MNPFVSIIIGLVAGILAGIPTAILLLWWLEHKGWRLR